MGNDREHFESYRAQTMAKHTILEKYIFAFFNILKAGSEDLVYIDAFAGRGFYVSQETGERLDGSPVRALRKIASLPDLASLVTTIFIESDPILAADLQSTVEDFYKANDTIRKPRLAVGRFAEQMGQQLDYLESQNSGLAPTFLFVDPCGVAGASFATIERVMKNDKCELLLFFNIDGIRRILGLGDNMGATLGELLGTSERAQELRLFVAEQESTSDKETAIVSYYAKLVRERIGAKFLTAFRVENEERRVTSHYLIHVTKSPLGFRIMKDVMWKVGSSDEQTGGLSLEQASKTGSPMLVRPRWEQLKQAILDVLQSGPRRASYFYHQLSEEPGNLLCESAVRARPAPS